MDSQTVSIQQICLNPGQLLNKQLLNVQFHVDFHLNVNVAPLFMQTTFHDD